MKLKDFENILKLLTENNHKYHQLYKLGVDIIGFNEDLYKVINILLKNIYGTEGKGWIEWYLYEKLNDPTLDAFDENQQPICYDVKSLWEYVEKIRKENHK
jgi:hypothetical protein